MRTKVIIQFTSILLLMMVVPSCGKEDTESTEIPYVYVNFTIDPSSIEYGNLNIPGNYALIKGGYRGIIVYHYTQDEYLAFERTCTYDPTESCSRLVVDETGVIARDTCCGSRFLLLDGTPMEGSKATRSLRQYRTTYDAYYRRLHIYN